MYLLTETMLTLSLESYVSRTLMIFTLVLLAVRKTMNYFKGHPIFPTPPGPVCFPFVGYLPLLKGDYHLRLTQLTNEYGPICQLFLGGKRVVVISDYNLIREAFRQQVFSGRPDTQLTKLLQGYGVINAEGPRWREQRAFLHTVLRDFGARNFENVDSPLQRNIKAQVYEFMEYLQQNSRQSVNVRVSLARAISNVIGSILMSVTFDDADGGFVRLLNLIDEGFQLLTVGAFVNFVPFLRHIPYFNRGYVKIQQNMKETSNYFREVANNHKRTLDVNNVRDFVDAFYVQQQRLAAQNKKSFFTEEQLLQVMGDIFSAGLETVTSTLEWALVFMVLNPEVQQKVFEEIERVVGTEREPEFSDLRNMPYFEATMMEVQRRGNVIALGNTHSTLEDTVLGGYFIPKNTHIVPNLWAVHMNPYLWDEPEAFKPERFISENKIVKPSYFMPFSVGRRMCIGDTVSRMEIFHFLSNIIQKFELQVPKDEAAPDLNGVSHISLKPLPFNICAVSRSQTSTSS